jgi:hypothetical protein
MMTSDEFWFHFVIEANESGFPLSKGSREKMRISTPKMISIAAGPSNRFHFAGFPPKWKKFRSDYSLSRVLSLISNGAAMSRTGASAQSRIHADAVRRR